MNLGALPFARMHIRKVDEELQIVYGEVYVPMARDSHGEFMTADTIRNMAHQFLAKGLTDKIDTNHDNELNGSTVVESFIAREGDDVFIADAWVMGVKVNDSALWKRIKSGEINGFSLEAMAHGRQRKVALMVPDRITGQTMSADGHTHEYVISIGDNGEIFGHTIEDDNHPGFHTIVSGTATEEVDGHRHRFEFLDALQDMELLSEA